MDTSIQYTPAGRVQLKGKAATKRGKKLQILRARGAFLFLPARCSSDLVHGSWYMLYGCFFSMFMALVLLIDIFFPFFDVPESTSLPVFGQSATWILLILSSFFYTVGTYIMLRAFEDPPKPPLLPNWRHFGSDELLSSWIFLVAALPALPYALFYLQDPNLATNWALVFGAIFLITVSVYFVYCCYPSQLEQMV